MRRRRLQLLLLAGPFSVTACALVADLGDRTLGKIDAGVSAAETTDAPVASASATTTATATSTVPPSTAPSYCAGIVLYASFDTKVTGSLGWPTAETEGTVAVAPGAKFGAGASLTHDATGAALYLVNAAANPWPNDVGSLAVWYRQAPGTAWGTSPETAPVLYRPVATLPTIPPGTLATAGLSFYLFFDTTATSGLFELSSTAQQPVLTVSQGSMAQFLKNDFNHYFTAWRRVGPGPTAYFALNGGLGIVTQTGAAEPPLPDSGAEVVAPYKAFTSTPWVSEGPGVALRLGGPIENNPDGVFDDLVVWNRVLSFEEAAAVYQSTTSVGTACSLPL